MQRNRNLPPLLKSEGGKKITTAGAWMGERRGEILDLFATYVYGKLPSMDDVAISFRLADQRSDATTMAGQATRKTIEITAERNGVQHSFPLVLFTPAKAEEPVPLFLLLANSGIKDADPARHFLSSFWPAETIVSRGYATAVIFTHDIAPDYDEGFTMGFHKLFGEYATEDRPSDAWGTISVWSWGASRVMDYLETDSDIDASKVAIVGHSRGGKTALWTSAQDTRFAMVVSSCAGNSGDALSRDSRGETVADITGRFPYWFCKNYRQFANAEKALPFDQHMLLALTAPRLLYTTSKTFDSWADPAGQFASLVEASIVWEFLGEKGIEKSEMPLPEAVLQEGKVAHHYKSGYHDLDEYDWNHFLTYADRYLR